MGGCLPTEELVVSLIKLLTSWGADLHATTSTGCRVTYLRETNNAGQLVTR